MEGIDLFVKILVLMKGRKENLNLQKCDCKFIALKNCILVNLRKYSLAGSRILTLAAFIYSIFKFLLKNHLQYIEISVISNTVFPTSPLELLLLKQLPDHLASRIELLQASSMYVDCMQEQYKMAAFGNFCTKSI